jgi:hypothetical protein
VRRSWPPSPRRVRHIVASSSSTQAAAGAAEQIAYENAWNQGALLLNWGRRQVRRRRPPSPLSGSCV